MENKMQTLIEESIENFESLIVCPCDAFDEISCMLVDMLIYCEAYNINFNDVLMEAKENIIENKAHDDYYGELK
jgi:hypothetical protein